MVSNNFVDSWVLLIVLVHDDIPVVGCGGVLALPWMGEGEFVGSVTFAPLRPRAVQTPPTAYLSLSGGVEHLRSYGKQVDW